jgi:hypothetical protein
MKLIRNKNILEIYSETRKRKIFVGKLEWKESGNVFELIYDKKYMKSPSAIALGPELPLSKMTHKSKGELFSSLADRLPSRRNPAYKDYCEAMGISTEEKNLIVLLGTIGKRGPSTFVFESLYEPELDVRTMLSRAMNKFKLTFHEISLSMEINQITVQRIISGKSKDKSNTKLIRIFLSSPAAFREQLQLSSRKLHRDSLAKLENLIKEAEGSSFPAGSENYKLEQFRF